MERLRHAITRAKAPSGTTTETTAPVHRRGAAKAVQPELAQDAWASLRTFDWNPVVLARNRVFTGSPDAGSASFDLLRTKVLREAGNHGWKRLLVTSPTRGCGTTTLCCNLAASFARQDHYRVIVVDLDLRRPTMARTLGYEPAEGSRAGFDSVLAGAVTFAEQAVRLAPTVALSMNIVASHFPSDPIPREGIGSILADIEARYCPDLMVFDAPPVPESGDALGLMPHVDCALMIVAAERSTIQEIDTCERELSAKVNVMGTILNKCRFVQEI